MFFFANLTILQLAEETGLPRFFFALKNIAKSTQLPLKPVTLFVTFKGSDDPGNWHNL